MSAPPKKLRLDEQEPRSEEDDDVDAGNSLQEQQETLVALINHRKKEVDILRNRVAYYSKELAQAEDMLSKDNCKLARLRTKIKAVEKDVSSAFVEKSARKVVEGNNFCPVGETGDEPYYLYTRPPKPKLIIPTGNLILSKPSKNESTFPLSAKGGVMVKEENTSSDNGVLRVQDIVGAKRKYEPEEQCKDILVANEKNSSARCLSDIGAIKVEQHGGNERRYKLEEHNKCEVFVKKENSSESSSDSEVTGFFTRGTKSKYGIQEKYIEQCKNVLVANDKNTSGSSSDIGAVRVQHVGAERKYERKNQHKGSVVVTEEKSRGCPSDSGAINRQDGSLKMRREAKQYKDFIPLLCSTSSACTIGVESCNLFAGQHRRKLRTLSLCPADDMLFSTSALDGVVNLWKIQGKGTSASLSSSTECFSKANNRRWPEDIAWHPQGKSLFCAYSADNGSAQVSIIDLNKQGKNDGNIFLEHKPHMKGIINSIVFMPWANEECFVTCGSDHSVIMWEGEGDDITSWEPTTIHRNMHSSAVMGVAGMVQRKVVLSVGVDKKIFGYDVSSSKVTYKHQLDSKCLSILPNPQDLNLFMVQTGQHERQLRLFDIRQGQKEVHALGWRQQCSESQSALVSQVWSPDGLYISSGSSDPLIHIFDVRYNHNKPSQSINAHQKRVFKAVWHQNLPLLVSISSDANIAMHKINM